jgi:hypothetical protein
MKCVTLWPNITPETSRLSNVHCAIAKNMNYAKISKRYF